jgi:hypothetical protein
MANPICPVCKKEITFLFAVCKVCNLPVHGGCFDDIEGAKKIHNKTCKICNKDVYMGAGI